MPTKRAPKSTLLPTPFLGGSYLARSVTAACQRCVNLYPEKLTDGKEVGAIFRTPGTILKSTAGTGIIRGVHVLGNYMYTVSGSELYRIDASWNAQLLGTVTGSGPVSMADNGSIVWIACNPDSFAFDTGTEVFSQITDPDYQGASIVGYIDGYFIFIEPDSQTFYISGLLSTSIDGLDFASAEGSPDDLVSMIVSHREIWLFGENTTEVWYPSGNADFPIERMQGAFIEQGCAAAFSVAKMDNSVFWLGSDDRGNGVVWRANGYTPSRVSTHAIETAINGYSTISDAIAYTYQEEGHYFYVLTFPTGNQTWVYDASTELWHERSYRNPTTGVIGRHISNCHEFFNGVHVVGDYNATGKIYSTDLLTYSDNSNPIKWVRAWRALGPGQNDLQMHSHSYLQLDCETGIGLATGQGSDPQVALRYSDDGGHTWSREYFRSMGATGKYRQKVLWRRLGASEDRVYEVSGSDPIPITLVGAMIDIK